MCYVPGVIFMVIMLSMTGSGCGTLLPPFYMPPDSPTHAGSSKAVERIHERGLVAVGTSKTDKQLAAVKDLTHEAMDRVSEDAAYATPPAYRPSLPEKIAYTAQFAGKAIEKTAPIFPLAPVVGGGITLLGSMIATGLGWGRLMRAKKMLSMARRDRAELEAIASTLIEGIENFSSDNTEAGRLLKEMIRDRSISSGTSTRLHQIVKERT